MCLGSEARQLQVIDEGNRLINAGYMFIERKARLDVGCILASCMSINTDWWSPVRKKPVADPIYRPVGIHESGHRL